MNVLSLFDGMSCGQIALNRAAIGYGSYYASEVDKYAIKVTQENYPNTVQIGDVTKIKGWTMPKIRLLIGGSPCQGFSFAGKQLNFEDPRSKLFFEYVRLLKELKPEYFLLENVRMKKEYQNVISSYIGVEPIMINSADFSAQNRKRLYWTNLPVSDWVDKGILLKDILEGWVVDRDKSHCLDANYHKGGNPKQYFEKSRRQLVFSKDGLCMVGHADLKGHDSIKRVYHPEGKSPTLSTCQGGHREPKILDIRSKSKTVRSSGRGSYDRHEWNSVDKYHWRKLTPLECERLQTVPDNYTNHVSNTQRYKMLGNGFTVDVIAHILKGMKNG